MPFIDLNQNKNQNVPKDNSSVRGSDSIKSDNQTSVGQSNSSFSLGNRSDLQNMVSNSPVNSSNDLQSNVYMSNIKQVQDSPSLSPGTTVHNGSDSISRGGPEPIKGNQNNGHSDLIGSSQNQGSQVGNDFDRSTVQGTDLETNIQQNDIDDTGNVSESQIYPSLDDAPMNTTSPNNDLTANTKAVQNKTFKEVVSSPQETTTDNPPHKLDNQDVAKMFPKSNIERTTENYYGEHGEKIIQGPEFDKAEPRKKSFTTQEPKEAVKLSADGSSSVRNPIEQNVVAPSEAVIDDYIKIAIEKNASDIHFVVNYPVFFRIDGKLQKFGTTPVQKVDLERLFVKIVPTKKWENLTKDNIEADFMFQHKSGNRFRVNLYKERGNLAGAFRFIPKKIRTIEELDLPPILKEFSKIPYGLVLVTGPTGSGKSTTIAAMIEEINRTEPRHIITIEDPVEYIYEPSMALISQRNMFEDTRTWSDALKAVLREDPDVVVIGEMRDYKTISSALTVAETGHLVFATLHTNNASQTIDRIIDVFPEGQQNQVRSQLSSMLAGVISQRLVPIKQGGRRAAVEILLSTIAVKNAIREGKTHQIRNIIQTSADLGMVTIEKSLVDLIRRGLIDIDTAKQFTFKPDEIDLLLK